VAKEVKTVRAAALSVGIFMMTGAGAVPVFSGPTGYPGWAGSSLKGLSFIHLDTFESGIFSTSGNLGLIRFAAQDLILRRLPAHVGVGWSGVDSGYEMPGIAALPVEPLSAIGHLAFGDVLTLGATIAGSIGANLAGHSIPVDLPVAGVSARMPKPGAYIVALTGLATLPFVRRRRLGPVPFK
jgi:hypothetical protein